MTAARDHIIIKQQQKTEQEETSDRKNQKPFDFSA